MANELTINYPGDATLYVLLFNAQGQVWNGTTFEAPVDANWLTYDIPLAEAENTEIYLANMPAVAAGVYFFAVRLQAGGSAAVTDAAVGSGRIEWGGSAELALATVLGGGLVEVTGPVAEGGDVTTYQGDSYRNADDRALEWESDAWPDLTTATIAVILDGVASFAGTVVTPTGTALVRLELTAAQSATIPARRHNFQVVATVAGVPPLPNQVYTLVAAAWVSRARAEV